MFGDISPKYPLPATFDQAVEFYGKIPEMISHTPDGIWKEPPLSSYIFFPSRILFVGMRRESLMRYPTI